jgi:hypothetical protein
MTDLPATLVKRNGTADLLKGVAVIFMIQVHIMEQFVTPDSAGSIIGKISLFLGGPACAPVFLAVMGYYLVSSKPVSYFFKRGMLLFGGGLLLNIARSATLLVQILQGDSLLDPWPFILGADILPLAGLGLVLTGMLRMVFKEVGFLYLLAALALSAVTPWLNSITSAEGSMRYAIAFLWGTASWSYFPVFPWFSYILAGYGFHLVLKRSSWIDDLELRSRFVYIIPVWAGLVFTLPYAAGITCQLEGSAGYYHHGIFFFGWVLIFLPAYLVLIRLFDLASGDHPVSKAIKWIGQKVTMIYVIQWLVIGNLAPWFYRSQSLFQFAAWFVFVTIVTVSTSMLIEKIRGLRHAGRKGPMCS